VAKRYLLLLLLFGLLADTASSQTNDSTSKLTLTWDVDAYYGYYTDSVGPGGYAKFPIVSPRNGFGLNTAMVTVQYDASKVRAAVGLHYGDIARSFWSPTFNNIVEAHAGLRLSEKVWLDAGLFRSHIGAEGMLPRENITSSVSVPSFFAPYFESGARLNYNANDKLTINLYALNGYNIFEDNNSRKSGGLQVTYLLSDESNIGYSNYVGDDTPTPADSISHLRFYNNVFYNCEFNKLKVQASLDYAIQANSGINDSGKVINGQSAALYSGLLSLKYQVKKKVAVYARGEMFNDPDGFLSGAMEDSTGKFSGLKEWAATAGMEYKPAENSYIRLEARQMQLAKDQAIFRWKGQNTNHRLEVLLNMGVTF
jgi:hypothetical protein